MLASRPRARTHPGGIAAVHRQGDPASPHIITKTKGPPMDPVLVQAAIHSALDIVWPILPASTLDQLAWV